MTECILNDVIERAKKELNRLAKKRDKARENREQIKINKANQITIDINKYNELSNENKKLKQRIIYLQNILNKLNVKY